ncbi:hypothetical protein [Acinetobacter calcoaceticus]|uniref:hypothetical protein n=1 Tax=Acinetobacter calcoaceticus TaxID=471 RepID=UPI001D0F1545|nr:hypothetical protein [Acinetobacter calcoaceticus]
MKEQLNYKEIMALRCAYNHGVRTAETRAAACLYVNLNRAKLLDQFKSECETQCDRVKGVSKKYSDLSNHIKQAKEEGKVAADKVEDKGTCNLDKVVLCGLDRVREATLKKAGIDCYKHWSFAGAFVLSGSFGMGDKNTVGVRAMANHLKSIGVDCYVHSQMD